MTRRKVACYIVREREYEGLTPPLAYSGKQLVRWGKWRTMSRHRDLADAEASRGARSAGIFERAVFYGGRMVVDAEGRRR